jgi:predicted ester cyclase
METGEVAHGRDAIVGLVDHLHHQAFAGSPIVRSLVAEGSRAAVEGEFVGRHVGEFAGIAPTGRTVRVPFAAAYDLAGGTIGALRVYLPMDALVRQLRAT